jgi:hypothetical protein
MRAIQPDATGNITPGNPGETNASIAWAHPRQGNYMQTPIVVGDFVFGCVDTGVLGCFDAKTGAIQFSERLSKDGQGYTASPVSDGRRPERDGRIRHGHARAQRRDAVHPHPGEAGRDRGEMSLVSRAPAATQRSVAAGARNRRQNPLQDSFPKRSPRSGFSCRRRGRQLR